MDERNPIQAALAAMNQVILGKERQVALSLSCLLARGHLLIEDLPGVGKTTLAHALARVLGLAFTRVQFTSDLLPADIIGVSVFNRQDHHFEFHPGPIFSQMVLADEVNRATPKTQSALLEAMEEQQVTSEGVTRPLPDPFFVIATQNPHHLMGTFPLPESQLDRFLMRIDLGYPDREAERGLLAGKGRRELLRHMEPIIAPDTLLRLQQQVAQVHVAPALIDYLLALITHTRMASHFEMGLSPRAGLALLAAARAWALVQGRDRVLPEDVQAILPAVAAHRLKTVADFDGDPMANLISSVPLP